VCCRVIEGLVDVGILSPGARLSSYAASTSPLSIAGILWPHKDYDVAVCDLDVALATFALEELTTTHDKNIAGSK